MNKLTKILFADFTRQFNFSLDEARIKQKAALPAAYYILKVLVKKFFSMLGATGFARTASVIKFGYYFKQFLFLEQDLLT